MKTTPSLLLSIALTAVFWSGSVSADVRLFVRHKVDDFSVWVKGYDAYSEEQKRAGIFHKAVYQSLDDPNDVTVIHDFHDVNKAKDFISSTKLKDQMAKLGVQGQPEIWITTTTDRK